MCVLHSSLISGHWDSASFPYCLISTWTKYIIYIIISLSLSFRLSSVRRPGMIALLTPLNRPLIFHSSWIINSRSSIYPRSFCLFGKYEQKEKESESTENEGLNVRTREYIFSMLVLILLVANCQDTFGANNLAIAQNLLHLRYETAECPCRGTQSVKKN